MDTSRIKKGVQLRYKNGNEFVITDLKGRNTNPCTYVCLKNIATNDANYGIWLSELWEEFDDGEVQLI